MSSLKNFSSPPLSAAPVRRDANIEAPNVPSLPAVAICKTESLFKRDESARRLRPRLNSDDCAVMPADSDSVPMNKTPFSLASDRIIRLPELLAILQISRSTAYAWQKSQILPQSVSLGPRAVGWRLSDIERFLASLGTEAHDD